MPAVGARDVLVRVKAAGVCHSDAHYRAGKSVVRPLPLTLGHEVAGVIERAGAEVAQFKAGDRVCLHYLASCGECTYCQRGNEQFCASGSDDWEVSRRGLCRVHRHAGPQCVPVAGRDSIRSREPS